MIKNKDKWSQLSMQQRADLIKLYVDNGVTSLNDIKKDYNSFGEGGRILDGTEKEQTLSGEPVYYDDTYIEPAVVKAFQSQEDYNRYYGEQFGKKVAEGMNNAAPYVLEAAMLPFTISGAVETPMLLYQGAKAIPQLAKGAKTLITKGKKVIGKKVLGMVDDISRYMNADSHFRIVDRPAIDDAIESGLIRAKTGLYHGTPEYLKANFSKYLDDIPGWEQMDANELRKLLESKGAFNSLDDAARIEAKFHIRNSTNRGGTVHYYKGMTYPNYNVKPSNFVIETPHNPDVFVAGHGGREYGYPLGEWGASLLKTNGSVKGASIPTKGSSYWEYSPFWEMWKKKKFATGGPVGEGRKTYESNLYNHKEEAAMYSYLRSRGVPHVQASAIMGNIAVESYLDPNISQIGGGSGYGLIQATDKARKDSFINYDGQPYEFGSKLDPETQRQLDYIIDKGLNTYTIGEWKKVKGISGARNARKKFLSETDVNKASDLFTRSYLRPGKPHTERRQSMSSFYDEKYKNPFENAFLFK